MSGDADDASEKTSGSSVYDTVGKSPPKRFRGGASAAVASPSPAWLRLLAPVSAFILAMILLVALLLWFVTGKDLRPDLIAFAVEEYQSPAIPINAFAEREVFAIRHAPGFVTRNPDESRPASPQEFDRFLVRNLQATQRETLVVYLSLHGVSDENGGYLLLSGAAPDPSNGYPIGRMLEHLAASRAGNVLLILNVVKISADLDLGTLGNDFAENLKDEFERLRVRLSAQRESPKNFWVLCSADDGQAAQRSPALGWDAFGFVAAYGLRGGRHADFAGRDEKADGLVSAGEFCRFVTDRVSRWSSRVTHRPQRPFTLRIGADFSLVEVDRSVRSDDLLNLTVLDPNSASDDEAAEETEDVQAETPAEKPAAPKDAVAAAKKTREDYWQARFQVDRAKQIAKTPQTALYRGLASGDSLARAGVSPAVADTQAATENRLLQTLWQIWAVHHNLDESDYLTEPLHWHYFQQLILRAERLFLARRFDDVQNVAESLLPKALEEIEQSRKRSEWISWSLAMPGALSVEERIRREAAVGAAIEQPTEENLAALSETPCVEADLLLALASRFRTEDAWTQPKLVAEFVSARTLAERAGRMRHVVVRQLLSPRIEAADAVRREAEVELLLHREGRARAALEQAVIEYRSILGDAASLDSDYDDVLKAVTATPYMLRWLGKASSAGAAADVAQSVARLDEFLKGMNEAVAAHDRGKVRRLARLARELRLSSIDFAENAWQEGSELKIQAALELPYLPTSLRQRLLIQLLSRPPINPLAVDAYPIIKNDPNAPINPFPLESAVLFASASTSAADAFGKLAPVGDKVARFSDMLQDPDLRRSRARLGNQFREMIYRLRVDPAQVQSQARELSALRFYLFGAIVSQQQGEPAGDSPYHRLVVQKLRADETAWQWRRILLDEASRAVPPRQPTRSGSAAILARAAESLSVPAPAISTSIFELKSSPELQLVQGVETDGQLTLQANRTLEAPARLTIDWADDESVLALDCDEAESRKGRLVLPLESMQPGDVISLPLQARHTAELESQRPAALTARIHTADGRIQWLPLRWTLLPATPTPAVIAVNWQERGGLPGRIDLFPNQQVKVDLHLIKQIKPAMDVRLDLLASGATMASKEISLPGGVVGAVPIPAGDLTLGYRRGPFLLRLYHEETLLDEQQLDVVILDPNEYFHCEARYDADTGIVTAHVVRNGKSDSEEPIAVELEIADVAVEQGILRAELTDSRPSALLQAQLPVEFSASQFEARIGVAGVARLFRFRLGLDYPVGQPVSNLALRLVDPPAGTVFLPPADSVPKVALHANGPGELQLRLGIDRSGQDSGALDASDPQTTDVFWMGRDVEVSLTRKGDEPFLTASSRVDDLRLPLPLRQLRGKQSVIVELQDGYTKRLQFPLYFVDSAPATTISEPLAGAPIAQGDPLPVTVVADRRLYAAVTKIEFGFDTNGNGRFEDDEAVEPIGADPESPFTFSGSHLATLTLPTEGLSEGRTTLFVRSITEARDVDDPTKVSRLVGKLQRTPIEVRPASESPLLNTPGTVVGTVLVGKSPQPRVRVVIPGTEFYATTDDRGRFRIPDVPAGAYAVQASTFNRIGRQPVVVQSGEEVSAAIYLSLR